jgi:hypothetical protein
MALIFTVVKSFKLQAHEVSGLKKSKKERGSFGRKKILENFLLRGRFVASFFGRIKTV